MGTGAAIGAGEKRHRRAGYASVMPGLVPGIHVLLCCEAKDMDGRDEPGHDGRCESFERCESLQCVIDCQLKSPRRRFAAKKNFKSKNISISDACAAVANKFVDRA
jgi:hypothetical protein